MVPLLRLLRMEHVGLAAELRRAMAAGPGSIEATDILAEAKQLLLDHLETELVGVLEPLRAAAVNDLELRELLSSSAAERALRQATTLFTRLDLACTQAELADAQDGLRARILWEEETLFPAHGRLVCHQKLPPRRL